MMKVIVLSTFLFALSATALKIHEYGHQQEEPQHYEHVEEVAQYQHEPEESSHHLEVEHKHATSHQSVKLHHFHPVPVYIKKEDQHLLKKPIEIGGTKQKLKVLHPKSEHHHGYGLVLENESESHVHEIGHYEEPHHLEHYEHSYHHE